MTEEQDKDNGEVLGRTWTHKLALLLVRPLSDTSVTPNHLTWARLLTGLAAIGCFAVGDWDYTFLGGWLWLFSCFMDRADGELARVTGQHSDWGHKFDMFCDSTVTALFFVGAGIGLRHGYFGNWAILMGFMGSLGVLAAEYFAEKIDSQNDDASDRAYDGFAGFDFDDVLYLFAIVAWMEWTMPFVVGASVGAPAFALLTWYKWRKSEAAKS